MMIEIIKVTRDQDQEVEAEAEVVIDLTAATNQKVEVKVNPDLEVDQEVEVEVNPDLEAEVKIKAIPGQEVIGHDRNAEQNQNEINLEIDPPDREDQKIVVVAGQEVDLEKDPVLAGLSPADLEQDRGPKIRHGDPEVSLERKMAKAK